MGKQLLIDVLRSWKDYAYSDEIYTPIGGPRDLSTEVVIFSDPESRGRIFGDLEYLLSFVQVQEQIEGFEEHFGRALTPEERTFAVLHYAEFDAPMDPDELLARCRHTGGG